MGGADKVACANDDGGDDGGRRGRGGMMLMMLMMLMLLSFSMMPCMQCTFQRHIYACLGKLPPIIGQDTFSYLMYAMKKP